MAKRKPIRRRPIKEINKSFASVKAGSALKKIAKQISGYVGKRKKGIRVVAKVIIGAGPGVQKSLRKFPLVETLQGKKKYGGGRKKKYKKKRHVAIQGILAPRRGGGPRTLMV